MVFDAYLVVLWIPNIIGLKKAKNSTKKAKMGKLS